MEKVDLYNMSVYVRASGWFQRQSARVRPIIGLVTITIYPRLAMDLLAGGGINYYFEHPGGRYYDPIVYLNFSLAYKVTPRLTLNFSTSSAYQSQPEFGTALSSTRRLGNYFRSENRLSAHYQLSHRLSSVTSYSLSALYYPGSAGSQSNGQVESSAASGNNRLEQAFSEQLRYLWMPTTTVSGAYRISLNESQGAGGKSTTQSLIAGLEQSFSPRLRAGLHTGVQFRSGNSGGQISPHVETSLRYELSRGSGAGTYII